MHRAEAKEMVRRLLAIVMEPDGFTELQRQDPHDREFLTTLRPQAYPFKSALGSDHNLVTLLAWADYLNVVPTAPNRFFKAKAARRLARVETDRQKTVGFSLFWPARIGGSIPIVAALCASVAGAYQSSWNTQAPVRLVDAGADCRCGRIPIGVFLLCATTLGD
jgi:hypothetical protein